MELGWQWPIYGSARRESGGNSCSGTWYSVGRMNYSTKDSRITDSVLGIEYDPAPPFDAGSPERAPSAIRVIEEQFR